MLIKNASDILRRMSHAAMRAGRSPDAVRLVAVTKTVDAETIKKAVDAGLRCLGENRVQEAQKKISNLKSQVTPPTPPLNKGGSIEGVEWHLIGHLQKNKSKYAVQLFDLIHTVDSIDLAEELNRQAEKAGKIQRILVQVKLSEEETKHGVSEKELMPLLEKIKGLRNLKLEGLMTMPPYFEDAEKARPYFKRLRDIRDEAERCGFKLPELSMGMSGDFEVAIEEGATMVRIGTAIFGERK
ncbi:MAG: YggS family pyridoxal phosphate-dependent enzyme [Nitrospirae bacterium]|nr:YggS family pyridoxal phosphate-dependent enzyme [Nitrospirota bacterium]